MARAGDLIGRSGGTGMMPVTPPRPGILSLGADVATSGGRGGEGEQAGAARQVDVPQGRANLSAPVEPPVPRDAWVRSGHRHDAPRQEHVQRGSGGGAKKPSRQRRSSDAG